MPELSPAQFNDRVTIQHKTSVKDDFGQPIEAWQNFAGVWANVRFQTGKEFTNTDMEKASTVASIRIRYRADITTQMRVLFRSMVFNISAVLPDSKKAHLDLAVIAGVNDG